MLTLDYATEVANVLNAGLSGFHRDNHLTRLATFLLMEGKATVDASIGTFLLSF